MTPTPCALPKRTAALPAVALFLLSVVAAFAAPVKFDIPAQSAPEAIKLFIKQSGTRVAYVESDLKEVTANALVGEHEPVTGLEIMLKGTRCVVSQRQAGWFSVAREPVVQTTSSIKGSLTGEGGIGLPNVLVTIKETAVSTETDRYGVYVFPNVAAGTYVLVASASGYQPMHITDVQVKAGRDLILGKEEMRKVGEGVLALEPFVVNAEAVTQLEKFEVLGTKDSPFIGANVDIPRTVNDAQPYYIFDAKTIDQSGATNIEDFLKQRLTMNTTALSNGQFATSGYGNTSSINLRGLGTDATLVLVDGRRIAGISIQGADFQPDLNGIPLSAIEKIEVLPTSASGIYGGSAIGGVINVILKKDYIGGVARMTYDNTWNTDSPTRTLSALYGIALEGGKTHVMLDAAWSDAKPLLLQDRRSLFDQNLARILKNSPSFIYSRTNPFLGSLPNIVPSSSSQTTLTLKNGSVIPSRNTFIAPGTSESTSNADLYASLLANSGQWNLDLPESTQAPTGLLRPFGATPETKSFQANIRRRMLPAVEAFVDYSHSENSTVALNNPNSASFNVPANSPANPFTTAVRVIVPDSSQVPWTTKSIAENFTVGAIAKLPWKWTGEFDYSWSQSHFASVSYIQTDSAARTADLLSGALNPFVDTLHHPLNLDRYRVPKEYTSSSTLNDIALRGSGPLWSLPWGTPSLTLGLEHRIDGTPDNVLEINYPITVTSSQRTTYFGRQQTTESGYGETTIPLLKQDWLPIIHSLELQLSGRIERYTVDSGTPSVSYLPNTGESFYDAPTLNGVPFSAKSTYSSTDGTVGLKYQPLPEITVRTSLATAFLPPLPSQLVRNPLVDPYTTPVYDPKTGNTIDVETLSGGNSALKPQSSKSLNVGVIWEPRWRVLKGLRLDAEYYRIQQHNYISGLDAQTIVNQEATYLGRVTRDASGAITLVDTSYVNLYNLKTEGWDLSADYALKTGIGLITLHAAESIIMHLKTQYDQVLPQYDAVNFPSEAGAAKSKGNATLTWEARGWTVGWTVRHFSSYKQYGAAGGPSATQRKASDPSAALSTTYILPQGSDTIPSQTYSDLFVGYAFGDTTADTGGVRHAKNFSFVEGLSIQFGIRNVFDKAPPFDVYYSNNYYSSPYGDTRLRSYWVGIQKQF